MRSKYWGVPQPIAVNGVSVQHVSNLSRVIKMSTIPLDAKRILRAYEPTIRRQLTAWLEAYMQSSGTGHLTLEDINVGVYKVLESLSESMEIDTGEIQDIQECIERKEFTSLKEFMSERSMAS